MLHVVQTAQPSAQTQLLAHYQLPWTAASCWPGRCGGCKLYHTPRQLLGLLAAESVRMTETGGHTASKIKKKQQAVVLHGGRVPMQSARPTTPWWCTGNMMIKSGRYSRHAIPRRHEACMLTTHTHPECSAPRLTIHCTAPS